MSHRPGITLKDIVEHKRREVEEGKRRQSIEHFRELIAELGRPRNFFAAVTRHQGASDSAVIAEIKRKSPSVAADRARQSGGDGGAASAANDGWIRAEYSSAAFDPAVVARQYHRAGAAAISCLTDEAFFGGRLEFIHRVKDAVPLPVLRKDFIIDPWQVWETRAAGADAMLLIAECLSESELIDLMILGRELQLTTLIEVHDMENLLRVRPHIGFPSRSYSLLGINNRDLASMTTDVAHTLRLVDLVDDPSVLVSESGIRTPEDLRRLGAVGVRTVLVGESLMREEDPGAALARLLVR